MALFSLEFKHKNNEKHRGGGRHTTTSSVVYISIHMYVLSHCTCACELMSWVIFATPTQHATIGD